MEFESTVTKAKSTGSSLRTTIPMALAKLFELEDKDKLKWKCEIKNDELFVRIMPFKEEK